MKKLNLLGSKSFIREAKRIRQRLGGGMRQPGRGHGPWGGDWDRIDNQGQRLLTVQALFIEFVIIDNKSLIGGDLS